MKPTTRQEWAVWVRKAEASELSISDFARKNGVSRSALYRWRGKLGVSVSGQRALKASPLAFVRLDATVLSSSTTSPPLEVALANGRTIPADIVERIAAVTQARGGNGDAPSPHPQPTDSDGYERRRALAEELFAFTRFIDAAVPLPVGGVEIWAQRSSRRGDDLRVLPGGRVSFFAGSGPVPARVHADDVAAAARCFGTGLLEKFVVHVSSDAVWQHMRAALAAPEQDAPSSSQ
jgi:transposase-like protein